MKDSVFTCPGRLFHLGLGLSLLGAAGGRRIARAAIVVAVVGLFVATGGSLGRNGGSFGFSGSLFRRIAAAADHRRSGQNNYERQNLFHRFNNLELNIYHRRKDTILIREF